MSFFVRTLTVQIICITPTRGEQGEEIARELKIRYLNLRCALHKVSLETFKVLR